MDSNSLDSLRSESLRSYDEPQTVIQVLGDEAGLTLLEEETQGEHIFIYILIYRKDQDQCPETEASSWSHFSYSTAKIKSKKKKKEEDEEESADSYLVLTTAEIHPAPHVGYE